MVTIPVCLVINISRENTGGVTRENTGGRDRGNTGWEEEEMSEVRCQISDLRSQYRYFSLLISLLVILTSLQVP
jgi:hypothetical protein